MKQYSGIITLIDEPWWTIESIKCRWEQLKSNQQWLRTFRLTKCTNIMININDKMGQFMTTYITYTQIYVVTIKNVNSPEQSIMTMYFLFNKMYADMMINSNDQMRQFIYAITYIYQQYMLTVKW